MQLEELSIEVTNECTLACIHCSSGSTPRKLKNELDLHHHLRLIDEAKELGATVVSFSGGNPLLCPWIEKLVDKARELEYERILMYTTGHHSLGRTIHNYMGLGRLTGVTWIFSMHSHAPYVNDNIMGEGVLEEVKSSIKHLTKIGEEVEVHMVPMQPNFKHIPMVRDLCYELGVKKLSLLRFVPQTRGKLNIDKLGMDRVDFAWMQLIMAMEMEKTHAVELRLGCPIDFRHAMGLIDEKAKPCHAGDDLILVRPDGNVHPCAAWKSLPTDSNVRDMSLHDIFYHSETFEYIRWFKKDGFREVAGCQDCTKLYSCLGGCPAQRLHAYDGTKLETMLCDYSDPLCPRGYVKEDESA